jgi:hypothetical protein
VTGDRDEPHGRQFRSSVTIPLNDGFGPYKVKKWQAKPAIGIVGAYRYL